MGHPNLVLHALTPPHTLPTCVRSKLHNNFLDGSVPAEWGQPTSFARMTSGTGNEGVCPTGIKASFQKCEM